MSIFKSLPFSDKPLQSHAIFWVAIFIPVFVGLSFGIYIWKDYQFDPSPKGYNLFLDISKLPFAIMALSIPLSALVAKMHSSKALQHKVIDRQSDEDEKTITHLKEYIEFVKDDLILVGGTEKTPNNNKMNWHSAANHLIKISQLKRTLVNDTCGSRANDYIKNLSLYLRRHLSYEGYAKPLPATFFFGSDTWISDYKKKVDLSVSLGKYGKDVVVSDAKSIANSTYGKLPDAISSTYISFKAVCIVYDFIESTTASFDLKAEKAGYDGSMWDVWDELTLESVGSSISIGAWQYVTFYCKARNFKKANKS